MRDRPIRKLFAATALLAAAGWQASCLPTTGPDPVVVKSGASEILNYAIVPLTQEALDALAANEPGNLAGAFKDRKPPSVIQLGVGDSLTITVFESAAGGLFIPAEAGIRPGNFVTLPEQVIDNHGNVTVPYAGTIKAAGRTTLEVQNEITKKVADRAIEPQVIVTLAQQRTNLVSVLGEVNAPTRFPAPPAGARDRITDALTRAGGIKSPGYETWVTLERNKQRATVSFENLISNPSNNIYLQPSDQIYVYREPQKFVAFGAAGQQGLYNFDAWRLNLAEAVGKAKGLVDLQADPSSVFLYRKEPRKVAAALGVEIEKYPSDRPVPVIFAVDFRDSGGYFLATNFQMRNQDVIFIGNAPSVEVTKFANLLNSFAQPTANAGLAKFYFSAVP